MIKKLTLLAGVGAGYVLGAKAGHERYEQIARFAAGVAQKPEVQRATATVQQTAADLQDKTIDLVNEQVDKTSRKPTP